MNSHAVENAPDDTEYLPVPVAAAPLLGCVPLDAVTASPVCQVAPPSAEEDSAFRAEGRRLENHPMERCRGLGEALSRSVSAIRMYRRALVRNVGGKRLYGVGLAYELDDVWMVGVARRLDDLNGRTLDEMKRTLRHEVSHTLGAGETPRNDWSAEDFADRCA